ncbi:hypothetical protein SAY86_023841 [Trapa natans]|uniref:Uncharacterized protein n=1 Tax=Trapa natans TaxID=22666 RepID=A0AAN7LV53_TRANT|nr:hypothetical protein SAY86_023841 [Trapa natans]
MGSSYTDSVQVCNFEHVQSHSYQMMRDCIWIMSKVPEMAKWITVFSWFRIYIVRRVKWMLSNFPEVRLNLSGIFYWSCWNVVISVFFVMDLIMFDRFRSVTFLSLSLPHYFHRTPNIKRKYVDNECNINLI